MNSLIVFTRKKGGWNDFIFRFRIENGMKLNALIFSLYNIYIRFGAEFTISGFIRTSSIFPDPYMKTSIETIT